MKDCSAEEREEWTKEVVKQLKAKHIDFEAKTLFLRGECYIEYLKEYFPNSKSLFDGKCIGEIMHWLDVKNNKANESLVNFLLYQNEDGVEHYIE